MILESTVKASRKFFESLFAYKPSDCRKLHNIANSVILFDESQSLPPEITTSTIQAIHTLCGKYRCTMVFSTATQPRFDALPAVSWKPIEIIPDNKVLYQALQRTKLYWRLNPKTSLNKIAAEMAKEISVCAIVNLRRHACRLYRQLKKQCPEEEVFFLTTDLCPAHRSKIINSICMRLKHALPCRVVATQCIPG